MARPRGDNWLEDEINYSKNNNVNVLFSLLERNEVHELKPDNEEELCRARYNDFINFPIPDRDVPRQRDEVDQLISS